MNPIIASPYVHALAWALVHFLWQGAVLGLAAVGLLRLASTPTSRYAAGVAMLAASLAAPIVTFGYLAQHVTPAAAGGAITTTVSGAAASPGGVLWRSNAEVAGRSALSAGPLAGIVSIWIVGVACLSFRLLGGWVVARRLARRAIEPVTPEIHAIARHVADRLAVARVVRIFQSTAVSVPTMIGWVAPVVLLPAAALAGLTPRQLEALLAHEIAHIRRHDYLINLLQSVAETLLFYHPVVWWLSRQVRNEREDCCDDLAIGVCGDPVLYATTLTELATFSIAPPLALAATDGSLLDRVTRILGDAAPRRTTSASWLTGLLMLLSVGALLPVAAAYDPALQAAPAQRPREVRPSLEPTIGVAESVDRGFAMTPNERPARGVNEATARGVEPTGSGFGGTPFGGAAFGGGSASTDAGQDRLSEKERTEREREEFLRRVTETLRKLADAEASMKREGPRSEEERVKRELDLLQTKLGAIKEQSEKGQAEREFKERAQEELKRKVMELSEQGIEQKRELLERRAQEEGFKRLLETQPTWEDERRLEFERMLKASIAVRPSYTLSPGDVINVEVSGANGRLSLPQLGVAENGGVTLMLIGTMKVDGLTVKQLEERLLPQFKSKKVLPDGSPIDSVVVTVVRYRSSIR